MSAKNFGIIQDWVADLGRAGTPFLHNIARNSFAEKRFVAFLTEDAPVFFHIGVCINSNFFVAVITV